MDMQEFFFYIHEKEYNSIIKEGVIRPFIKDWGFNEDEKQLLQKYGVEFNKIHDLMQEKKFIVLLDDPLNEKWIKSGFMEGLISYLNYKETEDDGPVEKPLLEKVYLFKIQCRDEDIVVRDRTEYTNIESLLGEELDGEYIDYVKEGISLLNKHPDLLDYFRSAIKKADNNPDLLWKKFRERIKNVKLDCDLKTLEISLVNVNCMINELKSTIKINDYNNDYEVPAFLCINDYKVTPSDVKVIELNVDGEPTKELDILLGKINLTEKDREKFSF